MTVTLIIPVPDVGTYDAKLFAVADFDTLIESVALTRGSTNLGMASGTIATATGDQLIRLVNGSNVTAGLFFVKVPASGNCFAVELNAVDWSQVYLPTSTVNFSGSTVKAVTDRVTANSDQIAGSSTAATTIKDMNAAFKSGTVDDSTLAPSTTVFETSRTDNSDEYTAQALLWTSGTNAGLTSRIASYVFSGNSKDKLTLAAATPNTPANGDTFYVLGRIE